MKSSIQYGFLLGLIAMVTTSLLSVSVKAETRKVVGQLGLVEGEVLVDQRTVRKNAQVHEGSVIEVKEGKATLLLGKGSVFHLAQNTKMIVNQFGIKKESGEEGGELDLRFGRTRALILNQGNEKKDLKIKARAATMGVRGTEIYIDAPKDSAQPVQFFTLEGKAEVKMGNAQAYVPVNQNQGVSSDGASKSAEQVKVEIKSSGIENTSTGVVRETASQPETPSLSGAIGINSVPQIRYDPLQDAITPVSIVPRFCSATGATGCP